MRFHMFSSDCCTSVNMIWVMVAIWIFTSSIELKYFKLERRQPKKSLLEAHRKVPKFKAPFFYVSGYMFFIRTFVQAIEPCVGLIVIFPGFLLQGKHVSMFFYLFFSKVGFFVIASIFNFPNCNFRMKNSRIFNKSYRKNLHVSNSFPMPFFRKPLTFGTRQTSPHQYS